MQQSHQPSHKALLVHVLRAVVVVRGLALEIPAIKDPIIDLELPDAAVDPLVDLAKAPQVRIVEGREGVADRSLFPELESCGPPDQLLPQDTHPHGGRVDLGAKRPLIGQEVENVAKEAGKGRRRSENLDGVVLPRLETGDGTGLLLDLEQLHPIDLTGKAATHKALDLQLHAALVRRDDTGDLVLDPITGIVGRAMKRPYELARTELLFEHSGLGTHSAPSTPSRR